MMGCNAETNEEIYQALGNMAEALNDINTEIADLKARMARSDAAFVILAAKVNKQEAEQ